MLHFVGEIVRSVRLRAGRSIEDLSTRTGVPVAVLEALEQGGRGVTTTQLELVAVELSLDPLALLRGREVRRSVLSVFLRRPAAGHGFAAGDLSRLDEALEQGRSLVALRKLLGEPPGALQTPAHDDHHLALDVGRWLGSAAAPLGNFRATIEERLGVAVLVRQLESRGVAAVCVRAEDAAVLVLDVHHVATRGAHLAVALCSALLDPAPSAHAVLAGDLDPKAGPPAPLGPAPGGDAGDLPQLDAPSSHVAALVQRAHSDELITDGEARAILGLDRLAPLPWER